jgi:hypothetical protein
MKISSVNDVREALKPLGKVVGLGVTAFPRTGIIELLPDYELLCIKESNDVETIRRAVPVKSVRRDFGGVRVEKLNTLALLKLGSVQKYLSGLGKDASVFVYKSSKNIEKIVDGLGLKILSNRSEVRDIYEDKWEFRRVVGEAGVSLPDGEQMLIDDFTYQVFERMQGKLGEKLVFQITDYAKGGGIGTFFITSKEDFEEFHGFVGRRREAGRQLTKVNVTKRIEGESASITGCVTRYGIFTTLVQRQIVDVREVVGYKGRSGVFCGHDWGERYSSKVNEKARKLAVNLGEYMYGKGYRGIFGIDLVEDRESGEVVMVECNPRYTAAFPVYSMMQFEAGEIPIDAWHLLEFSGVEYEVDFDAVQNSYNKVKVGAQLILHNLERSWVAVRGNVKAGVYKIKLKVKSPSNSAGRQKSLRAGPEAKVGVEFVRDGFSYRDIKQEDEFVLTDGVPFKNLRLKPGARIGRVIFKREVMEEDRDELQPDIKEAMIKLYTMYKLEKIKREKK